MERRAAGELGQEFLEITFLCLVQVNADVLPSEHPAGVALSGGRQATHPQSCCTQAALIPGPVLLASTIPSVSCRDELCVDPMGDPPALLDGAREPHPQRRAIGLERGVPPVALILELKQIAMKFQRESTQTGMH